MFLEHFLWGKGIRGTEIKEYRSKEVQEYRSTDICLVA